MRWFEVPNLSIPSEAIGRADRPPLAADLAGWDSSQTRPERVATGDRYLPAAGVELVTGQRVQKAFDLDFRAANGSRSLWLSAAVHAPHASGWRDNPAGIRGCCWLADWLKPGAAGDSGCRWWDTHDDNFWSLRNGFLPPWDQCYSALIEDLDQRGLLEDHLVVAWGEHGRTPRINGTPGATTG